MLTGGEAQGRNLWAFKGWVDVSMRQHRTDAGLSALNLAAAWHGMGDELGNVGRVELEGVMLRLVETVPHALLMELNAVQAEAGLWLLELGRVEGCTWWSLGGDRLDVEVVGLWLEGCGVDAV